MVVLVVTFVITWEDLSFHQYSSENHLSSHYMILIFLDVVFDGKSPESFTKTSTITDCYKQQGPVLQTVPWLDSNSSHTRPICMVVWLGCNYGSSHYENWVWLSSTLAHRSLILSVRFHLVHLSNQTRWTMKNVALYTTCQNGLRWQLFSKYQITSISVRVLLTRWLWIQLRI